MRLEGKVAIVTGGARNLGQLYSIGLAAEGASVAVTDVRDPAETVHHIEAKGGEALGLTVDVSDPASVENMLQQALARFGRIDILVNNAALYGDLEQATIEELSPEAWDKTFAVNAKGTFLCTKAVLPVMREQRSGSIINISSGTVWMGPPGTAHYVASKAAVIGLTKVAAREAGPYGIRVNAVTPGFTMSQASLDIMQKSGTEMLAEMVVMMTALGRREQPEDLLGTILFLASDDSLFVTGQTINVDGGWHFH